MNSESKSPDTRFNLKAVWAILIFTVVYRIIASQVPMLSNTSPTMALCFGGGLLLGRKFWWIPAALMIGSDLLIGSVGGHTLMTVGVFCLVAWMGRCSRQWNGKSWPTMWCGVLLSSILFYVVGNTYAWVAFPGYAKSLAGWWQCQTVGLPGFPPAWLFLRNMLVADSIWCLIAGLLFFLPHAARKTETVSSQSA